ncbi:MAG: Serine hydroxymethyltransferase [Candidatus Woesebacteria bacterium GW2011_GWD2_40_19]|nr:MAG: Serine hydroxymethyltransferase [Candidatus Woesebacteria bacterium GW2011_GWD2_40_19]
MLIPSENYASKEVREAVGSVLMNKYSEGYSGRRYYQGNKIIDEIETFAIDKAKELFKVEHVNVQPYSGSPANAEVLFALLNPGDTIMGLKLSSGGHLTHGHPDITFSGRFYKSVQFGTKDDGIIDYNEVENLARKEKPALMIIGTTAYPLILDWKKLGEIADLVGSWLVADISHVSGLVLAGEYPSPVPFTHIVTTTTHKTLRGPRGAMIMVTKKGIEKDPETASKIDKAVFPGLQGGPHNGTTAGIAQALIEADSGDFKKYGKQIVINARYLAEELKNGGLTLVTGGTECHLMVVDLRPIGLSGNIAAEVLEAAGIIVNRNSVPNDSAPPFYPSGIRLGTPGITTRGMTEPEMKIIAGWILKVLDHVKDEKLPEVKEKRGEYIKSFRIKVANDEFLKNIASEVRDLCKKFPMP